MPQRRARSRDVFSLDGAQAEWQAAESGTVEGKAAPLLLLVGSVNIF